MDKDEIPTATSSKTGYNVEVNNLLYFELINSLKKEE